MSDARFTVTQQVTRPLDGRLADLAYFVVALEKAGKITRAPGFTDAELTAAVVDFWDTAHGED